MNQREMAFRRAKAKLVSHYDQYSSADLEASQVLFAQNHIQDKQSTRFFISAIDSGGLSALIVDVLARPESR